MWQIKRREIKANERVFKMIPILIVCTLQYSVFHYNEQVASPR